MRTFIAIELPEDIRQNIEDTSRRLRDLLHSSGLERNVRWTPAAKLHLTLRFLGDTSPSQQRQVLDELFAVVKAYSSLNLRVGTPGCFPNTHSPQVIWLGLDGDLLHLSQLQSAVEQIVQKAGYEPESRAYSPHLTIGRVRRGLSGAERRKLGNCLSGLLEQEDVLDEAQTSTIRSRLDFDVRSLVLMRSVLKPEGAQYTVIERMQLG